MTSLSKKSSASSGAGPCESRVGLEFHPNQPYPHPLPLNPNQTEPPYERRAAFAKLGNVRTAKLDA